MALVLNEDQQLLKDSAKNFCQQNSPVSVLRRLRDSKDEIGFDQNLWKQMLELGWAGMAIPEAYGGFDFGYSGLGIVLEESGRKLTSSPLISTVLIGATAINEIGSEEQKRELLPKIAAGELMLSLALDEGIVHCPNRIKATATKSEDGYRISGEKTFVLDGHVADKLIVVARTSGETENAEGISLFLVDTGLAGVNISRTWMVDSRNSAKVSFDNVNIDAACLLGDENGGFAALDYVLDIARIGLAAEMLGSIEEVFERIVEYLKQREQFGVLIGSFQGLQHRAANMYSEIELCKSVVRAALAALDNKSSERDEIAELASITKAKLSEVFFLVSNEGVQMHGGIGMTDEFDIGFYIKRARVAQQYLGDAAFHRDRYASLNNF
ncbi:MAG: acyl-CoA/acyl-ACP dehydrogenase [Gammaproteobacteria bacterium]|nr:acyl-CoA/acyl-ACP dehydrogenase [Gammaproteobacteria bacterium]MDD9895774.1 acyl-CoA/acyl-ACP dehydrogenase [Gammaproteobacteria bacterium]MDD9959905.1 acyl-CoA/acyl-ACP dehydrogenase [Gammaproteobacteria bacterium]